MKKIYILLFLFAFSFSHATKPAEKWKIKRSFMNNKYIYNVEVNAEEKKFLVHDKKRAMLLDWDINRKVILKHATNSWKPTFSPTNKHVITASHYDEITLSDTNGKEIMNIKPSSSDDTLKGNDVVKFNPNGNRILTAGWKKIALWDLENGKQVAGYKIDNSRSVDIGKFFPHDERVIFIGYSDHYKEADIWDIRSNKIIEYKNIGNDLKSVNIHPEGNYLACIKNTAKTPYIYDLRARNYTYLSCFFQDPRSAKFNSTGTHILTKYYDHSCARLWNTQVVKKYLNRQKDYPEPDVTLRKDNLSSAEFHPQEANRILTYSSDAFYYPENSISIWDINGKELATFPHEKTLYSAKFVRPGNYIISTHKNNIVTLWKKVSGKKNKNK